MLDPYIIQLWSFTGQGRTPASAHQEANRYANEWLAKQPPFRTPDGMPAYTLSEHSGRTGDGLYPYYAIITLMGFTTREG